MLKRRNIFIGLSVLSIALIVYICMPETRNVVNSQNFKIIFSDNIPASKMDTLSKILENSHLNLQHALYAQPTSIEVHVYAQSWRYLMATKKWNTSGSIEGSSKIHFVFQDDALLDSKSAIHELTHAVVYKILLDRHPQHLLDSFDEKFQTFPYWLWESISLFEAKQFTDPKTLPYFNNGQHPILDDLNDRSGNGKIKDCGYTIVEFIRYQYGQDRLTKLIWNYGDVPYVLGVSEQQLFDSWNEYVIKKYLQPS